MFRFRTCPGSLNVQVEGVFRSGSFQIQGVFRFKECSGSRSLETGVNSPGHCSSHYVMYANSDAENIKYKMYNFNKRSVSLGGYRGVGGML